MTSAANDNGNLIAPPHLDLKIGSDSKVTADVSKDEAIITNYLLMHLPDMSSKYLLYMSFADAFHFAKDMRVKTYTDNISYQFHAEILSRVVLVMTIDQINEMITNGSYTHVQPEVRYRHLAHTRNAQITSWLASAEIVEYVNKKEYEMIYQKYLEKFYTKAA
jgi:hypothetical protein